MVSFYICTEDLNSFSPICERNILSIELSPQPQNTWQLQKMATHTAICQNAVLHSPLSSQSLSVWTNDYFPVYYFDNRGVISLMFFKNILEYLAHNRQCVRLWGLTSNIKTALSSCGLLATIRNLYHFENLHQWKDISNIGCQ